MSWKEKNFEEKMTPHINNIYKGLFANKLLEIKRSNRDLKVDSNLLFMDINLGIDTLVKFKNGSVLTFQEKTLQHTKQKYNSFTFEYYNDPKIKDEGEWFKLAAQLYFFGYANEKQNSYNKFWILDIPKLRTRLMQNYTITEIEKKWLRFNPPPAKANFFAIPFDVLESEDFKGVVLYNNVHGERKI